MKLTANDSSLERVWKLTAKCDAALAAFKACIEANEPAESRDRKRAAWMRAKAAMERVRGW